MDIETIYLEKVKNLHSIRPCGRVGKEEHPEYCISTSEKMLEYISDVTGNHIEDIETDDIRDIDSLIDILEDRGFYKFHIEINSVREFTPEENRRLRMKYGIPEYFMSNYMDRFPDKRFFIHAFNILNLGDKALISCSWLFYYKYKIIRDLNKDLYSDYLQTLKCFLINYNTNSNNLSLWDVDPDTPFSIKVSKKVWDNRNAIHKMISMENFDLSYRLVVSKVEI